MANQDDKQPAPDSGLAALVLMLRFHGIAADGAQIRHKLGGAKVDARDIVRCARDFGLKSREHRSRWRRLDRTPLPAIALLRDGGYLILGKVIESPASSGDGGSEIPSGGGKILVQNPLAPRPEVMTRAALEEAWDGRLILMTRRADSDRPRRGASTSAGSSARWPSTGSCSARCWSPRSSCRSSRSSRRCSSRSSSTRCWSTAASSTLDVLVVGAGRDLRVRGDARGPAHLSLLAHHQSHRRRARRAALPSPAGACRSPISRRGAPATPWRACASSRTSAIS